ncbi:MAG: TlpA family protein disulfide reductase [Gammaproteobacteria bacterium]|nr:TlpA family protein disulfide reductase [Gammaproteobacteria bacterium]
MISAKKALPILVILFISTISSYAVQRYLVQQNASNQIPVRPELATTGPDGQPLIRPEFAMADINGQVRNIKEWDGKIILLNFWATWCPPCLREIPEFVELQEKYGEQGFQVIGIAVDNEEDVRDYMNETEINYPIVAAESEGVELSSRYGNKIGGLPYTVIINRKGEISDKIMGELSKIKAEKILEKLNIKL